MTLSVDKMDGHGHINAAHYERQCQHLSKKTKAKQ